MALNWYEESNMQRAFYSPELDYTGWVVDLGDGTCRYVHSPLMGEDGPSWGDRVPLVDIKHYSGMKLADHTTVIERYEDED